MKYRALIVVAALIALPLTVMFQPTQSVQAVTVSDLQKQQAAAAAAAKAAAAAAAQKKAQADAAAAKAQEVAKQIQSLQSDISDTVNQIQTTSQQIDDQNQQIALLTSSLEQKLKQRDALLVYLDISMVSKPNDLALFSDHPSEAAQQKAQLTALKNSVAVLYTQTSAQKAVVETARAQLVKKTDDLSHLQIQQNEQKKGLAVFRSTQLDFQKNAIAAAAQFQQQADQASKDVARFEVQIQNLLTQTIANAKNGLVGHGPGVGTRVSVGDAVGNEGCSGFCTGPHVHFEVRVNNKPVDPSPYVSDGTLKYPVSSFTITQGFGYTSFAQSGAYGGAIHTGLDLAGPYGQTVRAPANGTVILNETISGYGRAWAEQLDNGLVVLLGHMIPQ